MKKIERIRAREAARVCLIESENLLKIAKDKLLGIAPGNLRLREDFDLIFERIGDVLIVVVDEQSEEK